MAYKEVNGKRFDNPHAGRLDGLRVAEREKEALTTQEVDTLSFIYTKQDPRETMDPDKVPIYKRYQRLTYPLLACLAPPVARCTGALFKAQGYRQGSRAKHNRRQLHLSLRKGLQVSVPVA